MAKFRSSENFSTTYASYKKGIAISVEDFVHIKVETTPRTFAAPSIGTQGSSASASSPSTDIHAGPDANFKINVDGTGIVAVALTLTGLTSGALIAAALETAINNALSTAGYDARVWVAYSTIYTIKSQKTGTGSSVVVTAGASNDVAVDLKLGVANGGTEAAGTAGGDFCFQTKTALKMTQDIQNSLHKSGRQAASIIKKKKMADGSISMYFNVATGGSPTLDTPVALLLQSIFGLKTAIGSTEIRFDSTAPQNQFFSIVQGSNILASYFNGAFVNSLNCALPGDGEATMTMPIKAADALRAGIAKLNGPVSSSATITLVSGESNRFDVGVPVMLVDTDGRTVLYGQDGSLTVSSRTDGSQQIVLSTTVTLSDLSFVVPFLPHVFDQSGTDNPITGLSGTVSFDGGSTTVDEIKSVDIGFDPKLEHFDNWYGADGNRGFVPGDKSAITIKLEVVMDTLQVNQIIKAREFTTASMQIILGSASGRHIEWDLPKVYFKIPSVEIPDKGTMLLVLEGIAVQSAIGQLDAVKMRYL